MEADGISLDETKDELSERGVPESEQVAMLLEAGFEIVDLIAADYSQAALHAGGVTDREYAAAASASTAAARKTPQSTTIVVVIAVVVILIVVVGAVVYVQMQQAGGQSARSNEGPASFENPFYAAAPSGNFNANPVASEHGYMDVPGVGAGSNDSANVGASGYMDVAANQGANDGGGFGSDDEEV